MTDSDESTYTSTDPSSVTNRDGIYLTSAKRGTPQNEYNKQPKVSELDLRISEERQRYRVIASPNTILSRRYL